LIGIKKPLSPARKGHDYQPKNSPFFLTGAVWLVQLLIFAIKLLLTLQRCHRDVQFVFRIYGNSGYAVLFNFDGLVDCANITDLLMVKLSTNSQLAFSSKR